ncbi:MAG: DUF4870 domain-containing protein [Planctomycetota bacterium]
MSELVNALERLSQLRAVGAISEAEFADAKQKVLDAHAHAGAAVYPPYPQIQHSGVELPYVDDDDACDHGCHYHDDYDHGHDRHYAAPGEPLRAGQHPGAANGVLIGLHLAQYCNFVFPLAGLIVPIVLWQSYKDDPEVDRHGRAVVNFQISMLIWLVVSLVLTIALVGIGMLFAVGILALACPAIGAIQSSRGHLMQYPLAIPFFPVPPPDSAHAFARAQAPPPHYDPYGR